MCRPPLAVDEVVRGTADAPGLAPLVVRSRADPAEATVVLGRAQLFLTGPFRLVGRRPALSADSTASARFVAPSFL